MTVTMRTVLVLLGAASAAVALPFTFPGQAAGNAQGSVTLGESVGPQGTQHLSQTSSVAKGKSVGGAPNFSSAQASSGKGADGARFANTASTSLQPGGFGTFPGFGLGFGGSPFGGGFGGLGGGFGGVGQASGTAQGTVSEGQSFGPNGGFTQIVNTGSSAGGTSVNGAPSISNSHASNVQGPGGISQSNTGASSVQPEFGAGLFGSPYGGFMSGFSSLH
ncbi:hypothetical protein FJT64_000759 [Amphibalanus amphitrite]|uniref:Uncharacterized protein n=2 Tax=Amphibalanus amphitrite TaxID=1232801 RepID=A0A6A4VMM3_AMPAM|nr:hypothetical protein FJT64_000759 [Amphibalanus amphitrite]